jgi:hypothetical protein
MPLEAPAESTETHQRRPATSPYPGEAVLLVGGLLRVTAVQGRWASRAVAE